MMRAVCCVRPLCVRLQRLSLSRALTPFLHFCPTLFLSLFPLQTLQEVIDILDGVQDEQALRMAANLGFKGPLQRQVMGNGFNDTMQRRGRQIYKCLVTHTHRLAVMDEYSLTNAPNSGYY